MNKDKFIEELKKINIVINDDQLDKLEEYYNILIEQNKVMNLTGITLKEDVYLKHFYDSLTLNKIIDLNNITTLLDMGTGAGFPGLVIKIVFPNIKVTLVDALNKRVNFLNMVKEKLGLDDLEIIHARCEEYAKEIKEKYDLVTARAVAHLSNLLEYSASTIKINGYFVAMKANIDEELKESENALEKLNLKLDEKLEFNLPIENSKRTLLKFKKISKTSSKYPRNYNEIKKKRL